MGRNISESPQPIGVGGDSHSVTSFSGHSKTNCVTAKKKLYLEKTLRTVRKNVTEFWKGMSRLVEIFKSIEAPGDVREDRREYQRVAVYCLPVWGTVYGQFVTRRLHSLHHEILDGGQREGAHALG